MLAVPEYTVIIRLKYFGEIGCHFRPLASILSPCRVGGAGAGTTAMDKATS